MSRLSRRDFLNFFSVSMLAALGPQNSRLGFQASLTTPRLKVDQLPKYLREILGLVPKTTIGKDGILSLVNQQNGRTESVPQRRTDWNLENAKPHHALKTDKPWGIVLHWYGDKYPQQQDLDFYMRGFNGKRRIDGITVMTSAHFLVGDLPPNSEPSSKEFGIVQTQKPDPDGVPFVASHISALDYAAYQQGDNYLMAALNQISLEHPGVHFLLQDFYEQPFILPHQHTIAIEISGHSFEDPDFYPCQQKIANVLSVVWAVMKRYRITAKDIMGHFELQLSKPDPGKKFLALIKYLLGIKALLEADEDMNALVFESFDPVEGSRDSVTFYFQMVRQYLLLTAYPQQIHEWDAWSKFLLVYDTLQGMNSATSLAERFHYPLQEPFGVPGNRFLEPENHEGVDFYPDWTRNRGAVSNQAVHLIADGVCLFVAPSTSIHEGSLAVFKHRLRDGSEIISTYAHLEKLFGIKVGQHYRAGRVIGAIATPAEPPYGFLHFSLAYGPSWEIHLQENPNPPLNAGPVWIKIYYFDPLKYLAQVKAIPYDPWRMIGIRPR